MSLFSLLRGDTTSTSADSALSIAAQRLAAQRTKANEGSSAESQTVVTTGVQITQAAHQAAAAKADAKTAAITLLKETRSSLDEQYAASGSTATPILTAFSNRALSLTILNKDKNFSAEEVFAAKEEMQSRDRTSLLAAISASGLSAASLSDWQNGLVQARKTMSAEEASLRDSNGNLI
jgi:hypothetical protein